MKYLLAIFFSAVIAVTTASAQGVRRMMLFAGDSTNTDLQLQRQWLQADSAGIVKRDIWIAVFSDPRTFRRMYDHLGADRDEFTLILMRKDGTEQFRAEKPVPLKELFEMIDNTAIQATEVGSTKPRNR
jgi:hypothetical protein